MSEKDKIRDPSEVESILQEVSQKFLAKQETHGYCFSLKNPEKEKENYTSHDITKLADYVNYDLLTQEENEKPFNHLIVGKNYKDLTNDGGVLKLVLDPGVGQVVPGNSIVLLHYIAYLSNIHEPYDVTYMHGRRPKQYQLGSGDLLPGLEIGLLTMTHGENARIIISPKYAYREMGCPPRIPPNATVLFDVHLVNYFLPDKLLVSFNEDNMDPDKFNINLKKVKKLHYDGNQFFKIKQIDKAIFKYETAKELLHFTGCNNDKEEIEMFKYLDKLYSNLSICYLKQCAFNKVCRMGSEGMKYSEKFSKTNTKLWFNWGKALRLLKSFTEGKKKLQRALKLEPTNLTVQDELKRLEKDRLFHCRTDSLVTFKNNTTNFSPEFWQIFNTNLKEFVDSSDDILTIQLNDNPDDIKLAENKANLYKLKFQPFQNGSANTNFFAITKK